MVYKAINLKFNNMFFINLIVNIINMFKRKSVFESSEPKRAKYDRNSLDRFGDDLCAFC